MTSGTALARAAAVREGLQREQGLGRARQRIGPWLPDCLRRHHARTGDVAALARPPAQSRPASPCRSAGRDKPAPPSVLPGSNGSRCRV